MAKQRIVVRITVCSIILMALIAGFSLGFAYPTFTLPNQLEFAQKNLMENLELYKIMFVGFVSVIMLDVLVSWTLFQFFKRVGVKY